VALQEAAHLIVAFWREVTDVSIGLDKRREQANNTHRTRPCCVAGGAIFNHRPAALLNFVTLLKGQRALIPARMISEGDGRHKSKNNENKVEA
jgi:hypothetical protein